MQISQFFFTVSPIVQVIIRGNSMVPILSTDQKVVVVKYWFNPPKIGEIVLCKHPNTGLLLIKQIKKIKNRQYWVEGVNKYESIDSRDFGFLERKKIIGKVIQG